MEWGTGGGLWIIIVYVLKNGKFKFWFRNTTTLLHSLHTLFCHAVSSNLGATWSKIVACDSKQTFLMLEMVSNSTKKIGRLQSKRFPSIKLIFSLDKFCALQQIEKIEVLWNFLKGLQIQKLLNLEVVSWGHSKINDQSRPKAYHCEW